MKCGLSLLFVLLSLVSGLDEASAIPPELEGVRENVHPWESQCGKPWDGLLPNLGGLDSIDFVERDRATLEIVASLRGWINLNGPNKYCSLARLQQWLKELSRVGSSERRGRLELISTLIVRAVDSEFNYPIEYVVGDKNFYPSMFLPGPLTEGTSPIDRVIAAANAFARYLPLDCDIRGLTCMQLSTSNGTVCNVVARNCVHGTLNVSRLFEEDISISRPGDFYLTCPDGYALSRVSYPPQRLGFEICTFSRGLISRPDAAYGTEPGHPTSTPTPGPSAAPPLWSDEAAQNKWPTPLQTVTPVPYPSPEPSLWTTGTVTELPAPSPTFISISTPTPIAPEGFEILSSIASMNNQDLISRLGSNFYPIRSAAHAELTLRLNDRSRARDTLLALQNRADDVDIERRGRIAELIALTAVDWTEKLEDVRSAAELAARDWVVLAQTIRSGLNEHSTALESLRMRTADLSALADDQARTSGNVSQEVQRQLAEQGEALSGIVHEMFNEAGIEIGERTAFTVGHSSGVQVPFSYAGERLNLRMSLDSHIGWPSFRITFSEESRLARLNVDLHGIFTTAQRLRFFPNADELPSIELGIRLVEFNSPPEFLYLHLKDPFIPRMFEMALYPLMCDAAPELEEIVREASLVWDFQGFGDPFGHVRLRSLWFSLP